MPRDVQPASVSEESVEPSTATHARPPAAPRSAAPPRRAAATAVQPQEDHAQRDAAAR